MPADGPGSVSVKFQLLVHANEYNHPPITIQHSVTKCNLVYMFWKCQ